MTVMSEVQGSGEDATVEKKLDNLNLETETDIAQSKEKATPSTTSSIPPSLQEKQPRPSKTPILNPVETAKPDAAPELTADQKAKYDSLLEIVKSWTEVPSTQGNGGPITDNEIMWLTRECLLRYLRATKWSTGEAAKRLLGSLTWRRDYGVEKLTGDLMSPENETGKQFILGFDIAARPCLYLNPGRQNTEPSPRQVQHLVFMVERVIDFMVPNQETLSLLINFKSSKSRTNTAPGIGQGREVLNILQTHYPERLGRALIINVPWIVNGFFKLITPFIDPFTRQKLKFNDDMRQHVPPQQLWNEFHGDLEFEYDHAIYWPELLKICDQKQAECHERWVKGGKRYGESEVYVKGGDAQSIEDIRPAVPDVNVEPKGKETDLSESTQPTSLPTVPAANKETVPDENSQEVDENKAPIQSHGTQAHGNTDIMAQVEDPVLTTKGDR